ncbi:NADH dehydrogenase 1 beta subcomplex subunit 8, mitochondrial [Trichonephila inaurata madagascariensis]|uniref:NADH dehydrogenase 1 beta subcomplex subunit 8, mitochondrial n=1 Tax=Trichonephila inaurata madagascariensis TaxID=2747483 RepID=A0A8X7CQ26_9ARAC|nr:NADH dehydrogenase 1 beta subcomplex subunit 8, mitochondrial [Trichonephila inaurata madagascariensis]
MFHSAKVLRAAINGLKTKPISFSAPKIIARNSSITTWNKDWKPGPYPRTEEERIAAAKKYNMLPEDYEPYPEEEGFGDYPKFKMFHMESRNRFEAYDYPELKRNYGEPIHPDYDLCLEDRVNFQRKYQVSPRKQALYVLLGVSLYSAIILYGEFYPIKSQLIPKQYPYSGQTHYTFESE